MQLAVKTVPNRANGIEIGDFTRVELYAELAFDRQDQVDVIDGIPLRDSPGRIQIAEILRFDPEYRGKYRPQPIFLHCAPTRNPAR